MIYSGIGISERRNGAEKGDETLTASAAQSSR